MDIHTQAHKDLSGGHLHTRKNNFASLRESLTQNFGHCIKQVELMGQDYVRLALKPPVAEGYVDFIEFAPDFIAVISNICFYDDMVLNYQGEDWIRFNFKLSGGMSLGFDGQNDLDIEERSSHIFIQPKGLIQTDTYHKNTPSQWVSILCKRERLVDNLGFNPEQFPAKMDDFLSCGKGDLFFAKQKLNFSTEKLVMSLMNSPQNLLLRPLYLKAKIYELLYEYLDGMYCADETQPTALGLSQKDINKLDEARYLLENDLLATFNMKDLSRKVGLNRNKLSYGFRDHFGITIFDFCKESRLKKACELLRTTDKSVIEIAYEVGYSHPGSFSSAFKSHYGATPRFFRNNV
ncbi:MAG: hypothetical protein COB36_10575 [Alphaproteobacteria bacterium]|nr:MAG: hypothetical protein COB36_10575 [Alphaproteobacteria bacterium]